jgi:myo-inositol-1-phosphate synthase
MHVKFGDYHVGDIRFVAAFDVDAKKVGLDLSQAIGASENNTIKFADVPPLEVQVQRGSTLRACKIAMDRGMGGPVLSASSYFMKSPPVQYDDSTAREEVERFLRG